MRIDVDIPDRLGAYALDAALEGLVEISTAELTHPELAGHFPELYQSGVRYEREHGTERWLTPSQVLAAGVGDCEDLATWRTSELRASGEDQDARARVIRSGPRTWHAVVERGDGSIEDPSRRLGMGQGRGLVGAVGGLGDWELVCNKRNGVWQCTLSRDGAGVSGSHVYGHEAIARACELGHTVGELGQIPGLDILARVARGALEAAMPPAPVVPKATTPGPYDGTTSPYLSPAPWASPLPMTGPMSSDVQRIASQISRLATTEATRKLRDAQRAVDTIARTASSSAPWASPLPFATPAPTYAPVAPALAPLAPAAPAPTPAPAPTT